MNHLLSASVSRVRRWRALVRKREPMGAEHEPTAYSASLLNRTQFIGNIKARNFETRTPIFF